MRNAAWLAVAVAVAVAEAKRRRKEGRQGENDTKDVDE
jgi:hypothetical protein